ncbi:hypothetical protein DRW07_15335 [Alteromonas sediminis]|uniref:Uncharacterized protein n=1 Tax=Alteromonas sediminis TaxID=2259342 RepID=A0A3N5Z8F2_9ALTE|nr:carbohydrate binding family 9 domain-containing protein [Alteromonas sediminis]RPJ65278.1 hypothetical protein DRW07_15335 [Alteromonas sediminis]
MLFFRTLVLLFCFATLSSNAVAQSPSKPISIPSIDVSTDAISIDGKLDESVWQNAAVVELNYVTSPFENTAPPVKTTAYLFENGTTLFVAFDAKTRPGERLAAFYQDRDKAWDDDLVGIKLDPFNNERLAYQFFVNPFGIQLDSIENEITGSESDSWNAIWYSSGETHEDGFRVEMAIPLKAMSFSGAEGEKTWRAELVRFYPRENRYRISNLPRDRNNPCILCQLGEIKGFENVQRSTNLVWVPTAVVGATRARDFEENSWNSEDNQEVGLDVNWNVTPQSLLQATFNPDFSQVEADVAQVSINNTFSLFFDELRPFFVENAEYFSTNQNLVYTRNINAPNVGAKFTGQKDSHTLGVFVADDDTTQFIVPGNLGSRVGFIDESSINGAVRYRYDVSNDWSVGGLGTFRSSDNYHNLLSSFDSKYQLTENDTFWFQYMRSDTEYPDGFFQNFCANDCSDPDGASEAGLRTKFQEAFSGQAYRLTYEHARRDWWFRADHSDFSEGFRADLGFQSRTDFTKSVLGGGYYWWNEEEDSWWNRIRVNGDWDITHNQNGELIEREVEVYASVLGAKQSYVELQYLKRVNRGQRQDSSNLSVDFSSTLFDEYFYSLYAEIRPVPEFFISGFVSTGEVIDYANNRLGDRLFAESEIEWNIGQHAKISFFQLFSELESASQPLFTARLTDLRFTYQFDARHLIRLIVAYDNTDRNPDNYPYEVKAKSKDFNAQLLYSYKIDPLTKLFIGFGQEARNRLEQGPLVTRQQSAFMKISYAWQQ